MNLEPLATLAGFSPLDYLWRCRTKHKQESTAQLHHLLAVRPWANCTQLWVSTSLPVRWVQSLHLPHQTACWWNEMMGERHLARSRHSKGALKPTPTIAQGHSPSPYFSIWMCFFLALPSNFLSSSQLLLGDNTSPKFYGNSVLIYFLIAFVLQPGH